MLFPSTKNNTPFVIHDVSLSKFHMPKRKIWAMLKKKKEKKNIHVKRHERKNACQRA
jgi:hypothetical protein